MCIITSYELIYFSLFGAESISYVLAIATVIWIPVFAITWILLWVAFVIYLDIRIFKRRLEVEKVLPDFLQLTSANIRAGMTIDRALWFAVRPRFGILANEIEEVAKRTLSGDPLDDGLKGFSNKYDSVLLNKSVNILIEGIRAGGNVGDLLNKIAINIQEMTSLKREMGANVTTYVIFISFASIVAAPVLFALSNHLLIVVDTITSNLDVTSSSGTGLSISTEGGIEISEYKWFSRISLLLTAFFSSIIVGTIMKGNIKETAHYVPIFILISQIVYLIAFYILKLMLSGFFGS
jgi:archaellum biogenesis protein FlaJ (TadC family)